jgi:hypothetical protein
MAKKRVLNAPFPMAGLHKGAAYKQQPPYSSPDMQNVRPDGPIEERARGGSRPGLIESHITDLGTNVRMLAPMSLAFSDGFTTFSDVFSGTTLASAWTQATWASASPIVFPDYVASIDYTTSAGAVVHDALTIDTSSNYVVEMMLAPWVGAWHGKYQIYLRMDNSSPDYRVEGVEIELVQTGTDGAYTASLKSYLASAESEIDTDSGTITDGVYPGWLSATVAADVVTVFWNGTQILTGTVDSHAGTRVGFGLECTVEGGLSICNVFRVQYYTTGTVDSWRNRLIASASGNLFKEVTYGTMTQVTTNLSLRDDVPIQAVQSGQKLYIADYGDLRDTGTDGTVSGSDLDDVGAQDWTTLGIDTDDDVCVVSAVGGATTADTYTIASVQATEITLGSAPGDGTCSYRIERGPKIYDPIADTLTLWTATAGQVPTGCPLIARFNGRIFLGGAEIAPHVWYASRQNDELDWDYAETDSQAAVAGTASEAGTPGRPLTALIAFSDDYLILACKEEIWRMAGDPAYGGALGNVSHTVGIIGKDAWCVAPEGDLVFLTAKGIYALPPGGVGKPIPLSRKQLPADLKNIDTKQYTVSLEFDVVDNGIHIFLTPNSANTQLHYWFEWESKTLWPFTLTSDHEPLVTCSYEGYAVEDSGVLIGCKDGKLRRFSMLASSDCGTAFTSYVVIGPIPLAPDGAVGKIISMDGQTGENSGDVTWTLHPGLTYEAAVSASSTDTGTWEAGLNYSVNPANSRGQAACLKISEAAGLPWAFEQVVIVTALAGMRRKQ